MLASSYNPWLVLCSLFVAILASYTALDMAARITFTQGRGARGWFIAGACAMGIGIWAMHFVGMLAFSLPIALGYDPLLTAASLLIAVASSAFALWIVCQPELPWKRLLAGALLMGGGVAGMHYTGMQAMQMHPDIHYNPALFWLSIAIAVAASGGALWITFRLRIQTAWIRLRRLGGAVVMGLAIVGMHYTGMDAAEFAAGSICGAASGGGHTDMLALLTIIVTGAILATALITSLLDMRMQARTALLASALAQAHEEVSYQSMHDGLTRLPNRLLLELYLNRAIQIADHGQSAFALLSLNVDKFNAINEAFGHHVGDVLLIEVAQRLRACVRSPDAVVRAGGDSFMLILTQARQVEAVAQAAALLAAIAVPFQVDGGEIRMTVSIGIAVFPTHGAFRDQLLSNAEAAMRHAKSLGRNRQCSFDASMNAQARDELRLLHDLRVALGRGELRLYYQAQFNALTGLASGVEALVRWQHPDKGLLDPQSFIPLAEKTGLILEIDEWVLNEACRQMSAWRRMGYREWTIAVNLAALQFGHPGLLRTVRGALERHALDPALLVLEVTEATAMHDVQSSLSIMKQLQAMGVRISIDDFGTGYSSVLHLRRLPLSELKIDRRFVDGLPENPESAAIAAAVIALGHTLKLKLVAEGVQTDAQQLFLMQLGCDTLQGFLLGRPVPPETLIAMLQDQAALAAHAAQRGALQH